MSLLRHIGHIRIHMADDHAIPGTKMTPSIVDPMLRSPLPGKAPRVTMAIIQSLRFLLAESLLCFSDNRLCRRPAVADFFEVTARLFKTDINSIAGMTERHLLTVIQHILQVIGPDSINRV